MTDDICYLVKETAAGTDSNGNEIIKKTEHRKFCKVRSATRNEYYDAATDELRPEYIIEISHSVDYEGEKIVKYKDKYYDVTRTYYDGDAVELTLTGNIGVAARNREESAG